MQTWRDRFGLTSVPRWALVGLLVVTIVGAFLRLYRLSERGVSDSDSGSYVLDGRVALAGLKMAASRFGFNHDESPQEILRYFYLRSLCSASGKPLDALLRGLALWAFGDSVTVALLPQAICGIITIPLLFFFARQFSNDVRLALCAAFFLAISPAHVEYSRGLKSEADSVLFVLMSVWLYFEAVRAEDPQTASRWRWATGLMTGMAFACNSRLVVLPPIFLVAGILERLYLGRAWTKVATDYVRLAAGFVVIFVAWELPYHWALLAARHNGITLEPFYTFWDSLAVRFAVQKEADWRMESWASFFYLLFGSEGPNAAFILVGIAAAFRVERKFEWSIVLVATGFGFLLFWYALAKVWVMFSFALAFFWLLGALGVTHLAWASGSGKRLSLLRVGLTLVLCVGSALSLVKDWRYSQCSSQLSQAMTWLQTQRPQDRVLATLFEPTLCWYDRAHVAPLPVPVSLDYLESAKRAGFKLLVIDHQKFTAVVTLQPVDESLLPSSRAFASPSIAAIELRTQPIATFTNQFNDEFFWTYAQEHNFYLRKTRLFLKTVKPAVDGVIRIYDLDEVLRNLQSLASTHVSQGN